VQLSLRRAKRKQPALGGPFRDGSRGRLALRLPVLLRTLPARPDAIERQLSHKGQGMRAVYNKAEYMDERRNMMQAWADHLDTLRAHPIEAMRVRWNVPHGSGMSAVLATAPCDR